MDKNGMIFSVPGRAVPAVRMTQRSKFCSDRAKEYLQYKVYVGLVAKSNGARPHQGDVSLIARFYFRGQVFGDIDNLLKSLMDGLNGIAWHDDKQVVSVKAERGTSYDERVEVEVRYGESKALSGAGIAAR